MNRITIILLNLLYSFVILRIAFIYFLLYLFPLFSLHNLFMRIYGIHIWGTFIVIWGSRVFLFVWRSIFLSRSLLDYVIWMATSTLFHLRCVIPHLLQGIYHNITISIFKLLASSTKMSFSRSCIMCLSVCVLWVMLDAMKYSAN